MTQTSRVMTLKTSYARQQWGTQAGRKFKLRLSIALGAILVLVLWVAHGGQLPAQPPGEALAPSPAAASPGDQVGESENPPADDEAAKLREKINKLIEQLGAEDYLAREAAEKELIRLGAIAYEPLLEALNHPDPEVVARARYILRVIPSQVGWEDESADIRELLSFYETGAPEVRRTVLRLLANLGRGRGWPALARLIRFEREPLWAKRAAIELLAAQPLLPDARQTYATVVRRYLGDSTRVPLSWITVYVQIPARPNEALPQWRKLVTDELALLNTQRERTSPTIVAALWTFQALAESELGQVEAAQASFARAQELLLPEVPEQLDTIVDLALLLQRRGKVDWAEAELRRAIAGADPRRSVRARQALAELLFDQGQALAAAQTLEPFLKLVQERALPLVDLGTISVGELRSRMYYFQACHWKEQGNLEEHRRYLQQALRDDPRNLDALIAAWQLPEASPEFRDEIRQLIARAQSQLERLLADSTDPEDRASYLNQLAWLVGNTQGNLDQALNWAKQAVELHPENGAYWDTLAHVYYHRGEWEKAVEAQTRATALEPGSGFLVKQLQLFRETLEAKKPR